MSFDYDDASRVIKKTFANQTYETYSYDPRSRVEWIRLFNAGGELSSHHYTYDPASNVETRTDNGTTTTFGYDDIGQLISESRTDYSATYSYDKNGNRLTRTLDTGSGPTTEVYAYDDADKLLSVSVGGNVVKSFSYDLAGRTMGITDAGGTTSLVYDYEDRVTSISRPGMTTNTFAYNGFGARVSKSDSSGSNTYLRASSGLIGSTVSDSGATYTPGVSEKRGTTSTYYHADIKNSVEQTSTGQGVAASRQYDAFGNEVSSSGPWQGPFQYGGAFGYHTDSDYGLKHLGARYYDSTTGRFLSRDPIGDGSNWYAYCHGNPVAFADPAGLMKLIVRGNDDGVDFSGVGHWWTRPTWDPKKDLYMDEPSKAELMIALVFTDELFYFWGHGAPDGQLQVNDTEFLTMADLLLVIMMRWLLGIPKMESAQLRSCWSCQTAVNVNMWLLISEEVLGFPDVTGDSKSRTLNTAWVFRDPISFDPKPHPIDGGKRENKTPNGKVK